MCLRPVSTLFALLLVLGGAAAFAQTPAPETPSVYRLYANSSFYAGSSRAMSLGGAYVGVADGAAYTSNHASFAAPSAWIGDWWDVDLTLQGLATAGEQDLDDDGVIDGAYSYQALIGAKVRIGPVAFGAYGRSTELDLCGESGCSNGMTPVTFGNAGMSLAGAFRDGQLIGALGLELMFARLGRLTVVREYAGAGLTADLLYRPHGKAYRVGASWRPEITATPLARPFTPLTGFARPPPSAAVSPGVLSLGMAAKLDGGGEHLNDARKHDEDPTGAVDGSALLRDIFRSRKETPPGRWLVTVQLDVSFPVANAVQLDTFVREVGAMPGGQSFLLTPHFGVEHVTFPGRLRLRGGTWLEPTPWRQGDARAHATFGFDLFLFHFLFDWGLTGAGDVARDLSQGSLSFGVWH